MSVSAPEAVATPVAKPTAQPAAPAVPQQPAAEVVVEPARVVAEPVVPQQPKRRPAPRIGLSINNMMSGDVKTASELAREVEAASSVEVVIDPSSEQKLMEAKGRFIAELQKSRARFVPVFETMRAEGNVVHITVASKELHEDIMRDKLTWLSSIARTAGVNGAIDLVVEVNEAIKIARPITIEDRLKHLMAKNDRLKEMIERLVLDAE